MNLYTEKNSALLLIDHQIGTMQLVKNIPVEIVKRNALALAKAARALRLPVVLTSSQEDQFQGPLVPELKEILPEAFAARVKRAGIVNAWEDPNFSKAVKGTGRRNLIIAAVTTDICLVFPALSARDEGYEIQAVIDACGSPFDISEEMARRRMEKAGVVLTATNTLLAELASDWSRPEGAKIAKILMEDILSSVLSNSVHAGVR